MKFDSNFIKKVLPHRYPILLVDRILEMTDTYVKAIKNVTVNEHFFVGHYPKEPVMPAVLMIEAMAQTSCFIAYNQMKDVWSDDMLVYFMGIDKARFRRLVTPGDQLIVEANFIKKKKDFWWLEGKVSVDGEIAAEAQLSAVMKRGEK